MKHKEYNSEQQFNNYIKLNETIKYNFLYSMKNRSRSYDSNKTLDIILEDFEESYSDNDLVGKMYKVVKKLGSGSFGDVYSAVDKNNLEYAIKFEDEKDYKQHLLQEYRVYTTLNKNRHFPKIYGYGHYRNYRYLVMQKLGKSLKSMFVENDMFFDMNTVSNIAVQILYRLQELHNKGWLHQDIKPENILIDEYRGEKLYLIDYGTSGRWWDEHSLKHIPKEPSKKIVGTARYSSIANHRGYKQCRRDDLESFGFVLLYFVLGKLPWQGIKASNFRVKWNSIRSIKIKTDINKLCDLNAVSESFKIYFTYVRKLKFDQIPDYSYLRSLFRPYIKSDFYWSKSDKKIEVKNLNKNNGK